MTEPMVKIYMPGLQRQIVLKPGTYWANHDEDGKIYFWDAEGNIFKGGPSDYVAQPDGTVAPRAVDWLEHDGNR